MVVWWYGSMVVWWYGQFPYDYIANACLSSLAVVGSVVVWWYGGMANFLAII